MDKLSSNMFRMKIEEGNICVGIPVTLADPVVSELLADAGYDFTWIDMEHGPFDLHTALLHILALNGSNTVALVRVASSDPVVIKPVLELEPAGIIVPLIESAEDARRAVAACKYPPEGRRGYGPRRGVRYGDSDMLSYLATANDRILVIVQIESIKAVEKIDEILAVEGLDGICVGPNDLSGSMGLLGHPDDPRVVEAIDHVLDRARSTDLLTGIAGGYDAAWVKAWLSKGVQWLALNTDWGNLFRQSHAIVEEVRKLAT